MSISEQAITDVDDAAGDAVELVIIGDGRSYSVSLPLDGTVQIGRASSSQIRIDHSSLSRRHAQLTCNGQEILIEDVGSINGTFVGGERLVPGQVVPFGRGQVADVGSVSLVLRPLREPVHKTPGPRAEWLETRTMHELHLQADRAATTKLSVLILGETGVGKDVLANRIHALSPRAQQPMVRVNCAALTESLLESEMFGYEKGAFSGALQSKPGLLETAHGGTFFLDEIGDMPASLQPKLLRVLEDRAVLRVGAIKPRPIDVRFVAATNSDIERAVERGAFRADLLHRLNAITFHIPSLRDRREEIPALAAWFVERAAHDFGAPIATLDDAVLTVFARYDWPGNVRELRNVIDRAVALGCGTHLTVEHLPAKLIAGGRISSSTLQDELEQFERQRIMDALTECQGNQTKAAMMLGLSRTTLIERIRAYGLPRPRSRPS